MLAWKATQIAEWYGHALLAIESNTLTSESEDTEGDHFLTIMDTICDFYDNLFARTDPDKVKQGIPIKYGFHTNKQTKSMIIDRLLAAM